MQNIFHVNSLNDKGLRLNATWDGKVCKFSVSNISNEDISLGDITLLRANMPFSKDTKVYGEGFNMLSQYGGTIENCHLIASFSDYDHYKLPKPDGINQVYNLALFYPENEETYLVGFCSCFRFTGCIRFNEKVIEIAINCENITIKKGETINLEQVFFDHGPENIILNRFAKELTKNHPMKKSEKIPTGWCSWLIYGPNITEKNVYDNLDAISRLGLDLKYIQIDDGYQAHWGDWFDFTDKFEHGVKQVCLDIKERGFEPAIWVAPFVAEKDSTLFKDHPDWFVKDDNGNPLCSSDVTFGGWRCAPWYILDMTNPNSYEYVKNVFRVMKNEWKIKYFKLDAIVWASLPFGHRYDDSKTSVEAYKMGMKAICEGAGEDSFILGGNSPMWPSIGYVNAMRVTNDNCRSWWTFSQIAKECFHRNWQHGKLWINDPDTVLLQNVPYKVVGPDGKVTINPGNISDNEFAFNAVYMMACGGMVLSGDDISSLTDKNISILKKLLPPSDIPAIFDDDSFTIGRAVIDEHNSNIYVFNFDDSEKDIHVKIDKPTKVYDLLNDKKLGMFDEYIEIKGMKPHYALILKCKN